MELRTLKEISEVATSLTGVAGVMIGGITAFFRGLPSRRQRSQVAYEIVKTLRPADLSTEGPREDLRLEYWYGALTGTMVLGAAEIRRAMALRPSWKGLRDFALAQSLLALQSGKRDEPAVIAYRHPRRRKFEMLGCILGYSVSSLVGFAPMFFARALGLHGWPALLLALGWLAFMAPFFILSTRGLVAHGASLRIMAMQAATAEPVAPRSNGALAPQSVSREEDEPAEHPIADAA